MIFGKKDHGTVLAKEEPTSSWATERICKVVTCFCVGPWLWGGFHGLVGHGSDG